MYILLAIPTKKAAREILEQLDSNEKLDLTIRIFIVEVLGIHFNQTKRQVLDMIEEAFNR